MGQSGQSQGTGYGQQPTSMSPQGSGWNASQQAYQQPQSNTYQGPSPYGQAQATGMAPITNPTGTGTWQPAAYTATPGGYAGPSEQVYDAFKNNNANSPALQPNAYGRWGTFGQQNQTPNWTPLNQGQIGNKIGETFPPGQQPQPDQMGAPQPGMPGLQDPNAPSNTQPGVAQGPFGGPGGQANGDSWRSQQMAKPSTQFQFANPTSPVMQNFNKIAQSQGQDAAYNYMMAGGGNQGGQGRTALFDAMRAQGVNPGNQNDFINKYSAGGLNVGSQTGAQTRDMYAKLGLDTGPTLAQRAAARRQAQ